jgi:uncharacterized protein (DUF2252 family)
MTENTFRFFRGTCHLFYQDLAKENLIPWSPLTWICGDLHVENFGSYKGDNRLVYFDLNDFDEAILAPANWEIVRFVTSIFTAFDSLQIKNEDTLATAKLFLSKYSATLAKGKAHSIEPKIAKGIVKRFLEQVEERKQKQIIAQYTEKNENKIKLQINNEFIFKIGNGEKTSLSKYLAYWLKNHNWILSQHYEVIDVAFRIAGTGSIGLKRYILLIKNGETQKYFLMDLKEARASALKPFLNILQPVFATEADRIVAIQNRMQDVSPAMLNTAELNTDSFVLKEMQPVADKINFVVIREKYKSLCRIVEDMAVLTASSQLRSSGRQGSANADELIDFGSRKGSHDFILKYALKYSQKVKSDYVEFIKNYKNGYFD